MFASAILRISGVAQPHAHQVFPSVPASSYFAIGAGSSFTWIEQERRMVVVVRWLNSAHADEFFKRVLEGVDQ
jgi:hypothetical protein